ncbi:hypothetical protein OSB04_022479 [Centaurea solstitialis]|uniref:Uncharacterized protein n=1 Tax=Centaurea solstitialis TaxID=347529 RepID=A0AA38WIS2_9ASTR|nr:hypothetical protein OSB04_022479 [Centaurea solstitialis]
MTVTTAAFAGHCFCRPPLLSPATAAASSFSASSSSSSTRSIKLHPSPIAIRPFQPKTNLRPPFPATNRQPSITGAKTNRRPPFPATNRQPSITGKPIASHPHDSCKRFSWYLINAMPYVMAYVFDKFTDFDIVFEGKLRSVSEVPAYLGGSNPNAAKALLTIDQVECKLKIHQLGPQQLKYMTFLNDSSD